MNRFRENGVEESADDFHLEGTAMKRSMTLGVIAALVIVLTTVTQRTTRAQTGGGGGTGSATAGGLGAAQPGAAGQMGAAGGARIGPPQMRNMQVPRGGVPRNVELYGRNPWFGNSGVQQQLGVNPQQMNRLNQAYQNAYSQYQRQLGGANNQTQNAASANRERTNASETASNGANSRANNNNRGNNTPGANPANPSNHATASAATNGSNADRNPSNSATASAGSINSSRNGAVQASAEENTNTNNSRSATTGTNGNSGSDSTPRTIIGFNADGSSMGGSTNSSAAASSRTPNDSVGNNADTAAQAFREENRTTAFGGQADMQAAQRAFGESFDRDLDSIFSDPVQRRRFSQLQNQFRGYDNLNDPLVQRQLNLTDQQLLQLTRAREQWLNEMNAIANLPPEQRNAARKRFSLLRQRYYDRINQTLTTAEQRRAWSVLFGDPYDFGYDAYFGADPLDGTQTQPSASGISPSSYEIGRAAGGSTSSFSGAPGTDRTGGAGSTIGTRNNPTPGTDIGTSVNPTPGTGTSTSGYPPLGTGR